MSQMVEALFDTHVHFRQGPEMREYVQMTARQCSAAIAMPNTDPPMTTPEQCQAYIAQINEYAAPIRPDFKAMMFAYLVPTMRVSETRLVLTTGGVMGLKLYPQAGTTNSEHGVSERLLREPDARFLDVIKVIEEKELTLSIHGEMPSAFVLDRERAFLKSGFLEKLFNVAPKLRVTLEHISSEEGVAKVLELREKKCKVAATITWHHLIHNVGDVVGRASNFCRPCPALETDRLALNSVALCGHDAFMLGSDSAPHAARTKHAECCSAGCYTSPTLLEELYEYFYKTKYNINYKNNVAERFYFFSSYNALKWYGVDLPKQMIVLEEASVSSTPPSLDPDRARWYRYPQLQWEIISGGYPAARIDAGLKTGEPLRR